MRTRPFIIVTMTASSCAHRSCRAFAAHPRLQYASRGLEPLSLPSLVAIRPPRIGKYFAEKRHVTIPSEMALSQPARKPTDLWALLEYNAYYFNAHRMASILTQLLEEPREDTRTDPRIAAYLKRAQASVKLYENIKDLTAKDIAAAVVAARELGRREAEELSDILVDTIADKIPNLSAQRVSFFVTAFAKKQIADSSFWRAAAAKVATSDENFSPQVVVSLFDAFRKSGVRSQKFFLSLSRRIYHVLDDLTAANIPPIIATLCRVPLPADERERAVRALLGRWLSMLRHERDNRTNIVTTTQILSLTVSLGLAPEEINVAVFARDVSAFIGSKFEAINPDDLIVFLWALQRLVPSGSLTAFFADGLRHVNSVWPELRARSQLSTQRLTQVSDVLVAARQEGTWDASLATLQDNIIQDLAETIQYCLPDGLAELLEIWAGNEAFWRHYRDFAEAMVKRLEELLLEADTLDEVVPILQAALSVPGLCASLPGRARTVLAKAIQSRGTEDAERVQAIFAGSRWESLCSVRSPVGETPNIEIESRESSSSSSSSPSSEREGGLGGFAHLLKTWNSSKEELRLLDFLRTAVQQAGGAEEALQALEAAAPFAQRLGVDVTAEVGELLEQLGDRIMINLDSLPSARIIAALHACAVAGLPHSTLFMAAIPRLGNITGLDFVEILEAFAALRLALPDLHAWFNHQISKGIHLRLPAAGLSRLFASSARLSLLDASMSERLLGRLLTVASPMRPPSLETVATLCNGLYLLDWNPPLADLWQIVAWLAQFTDKRKSPLQALILQQFALKLLADPRCRKTVDAFQSEFQHALALSLEKPILRRNLATDTTLKFKHEVAESLRSVGRTYDLDVILGADFCADIVLSGPEVGLWLIDGPEAFYRPFELDNMRLVPSELRRAEVLKFLLEHGETIQETVTRWHHTSQTAENPIIIASVAGRKLVEQRESCFIRRLNWLDWTSSRPDQRLSLLLSQHASRTPYFQRQSLRHGAMDVT